MTVLSISTIYGQGGWFWDSDYEKRNKEKRKQQSFENSIWNDDCREDLDYFLGTDTDDQDPNSTFGHVSGMQNQGTSFGANDNFFANNSNPFALTNPNANSIFTNGSSNISYKKTQISSGFNNNNFLSLTSSDISAGGISISDINTHIVNAKENLNQNIARIKDANNTYTIIHTTGTEWV